VLKSVAGYRLWGPVRIPFIAFPQSYRIFIRVQYVPFRLVIDDFIFTFCYVLNVGQSNSVLKYRILFPVSPAHVQFEIPLSAPIFIRSNYQFLGCFTVKLPVDC